MGGGLSFPSVYSCVFIDHPHTVCLGGEVSLMHESKDEHLEHRLNLNYFTYCLTNMHHRPYELSWRKHFSVEDFAISFRW